MLATDTDEPVDYVMPVKALPKAPVEEVSANDGNSRTGLPKPAGAACKAAVVALLRDAVAQGPVAVSEIERLVVAAGLLDEGKPLGRTNYKFTNRPY